MSAQAASPGWIPIETGRGCPETLAADIAAGASVGLLARESNPHDYVGTARNVITAAKALERNDVFPNLTSLMPSETEIAFLLQHESSTEHYVEEDGAPFECRFLTLRAPGNSQLHLHLACGSGRKIDATLDHQPVALHTAKFVTSVTPVVVCAAEANRWTRAEFTLDPWLRAMGRLAKTFGHPAYFSMDGTRPDEFSRASAMTMIKKAADGATEAEDSIARMIKGIRRQIPASDLGGYTLYPFSQAPPPPLATVWLKSVTGRRGAERAVIIDNPAVRDELKGQILYGLPQVFEADGATPVDQQALVRDFLHLFGRPEWPLARLVRSVVSRGLSTEGVRRQHEDRGFDWRGQNLTRNQVKAIADSILRHLEYYWTGDLFLRVGDKTPPEHALHLRPADGEPYLTEEDYHRIKTWNTEKRGRHERARRTPFGHLPATVNGRPGFLVPERKPEATLTYRGRALAASDTSNISVPRVEPRSAPQPACRIPAVEFATSLMRGLKEHHGDLHVFLPDSVGPQTNQAREELLQLEQTLKLKVRIRDEQEEQIFPSAGGHGMYGKLLQKANKRFENLEREIEALEHDVAQAAEAAEREDRLHDPRSFEVGRLLEVVKTLRDPEDVTHHIRWRESIRGLTVTSRNIVVGGAHYVRTEWSGTLVLHDGSDERAIPFGGFSDRRGARKTRATGIVDDLRTGDIRRLRSPYWQTSAARDLLRGALGVPAKDPMPVLTIRDPRLLRIAMAAVYPPLRSQAGEGGDPALLRVVGAPLRPHELVELAEELSEPVELVQRVVSLNPPYGHAGQASRKWETKGDQAVERLCRLAGRRQGRLAIKDFDAATWADLRHAAIRCGEDLFELPRREMVMAPCPHCGSFRRGYLNIREATEPVCWSCRCDVTGIRWPPKPYDRYRTRMAR